MTNESHEKALEAACGKHPMHVRPEILAEMFAAYLQAMDAVIVPNMATLEMEHAAVAKVKPYHDTDWYQVMPKDLFRLAWPSMLSKAPNHFTNGE
jgi:hypothetical protein